MLRLRGEERTQFINRGFQQRNGNQAPQFPQQNKSEERTHHHVNGNQPFQPVEEFAAVAQVGYQNHNPGERIEQRACISPTKGTPQ